MSSAIVSSLTCTSWFGRFDTDSVSDGVIVLVAMSAAWSLG